MFDRIRWLLALSRHAGEIQNIVAKFQAVMEADGLQAKNVALRSFLESLDPILADLDTIRAQETVTEEEAEKAVMDALQADGSVQAQGLLDRLKQLKDIYDRLQPVLAIFFPAPKLPG